VHAVDARSNPRRNVSGCRMRECVGFAHELWEYSFPPTRRSRKEPVGRRPEFGMRELGSIAKGLVMTFNPSVLTSTAYPAREYTSLCTA